MLNCRHFKVLSFSCLVLFLAGCGNPSGLDSVQVTPAAQSLTVGQTAQFTAVGTYGNASHSSTQNLTSTVTWTSSIPAVATVSASGVATAVSAGTTTITASATAFNGPVSSSATLAVTGSGGGAAGRSGGLSFAHHYSQLDYSRQFAGYWAIPGDRNVLDFAHREGSDKLTHVTWISSAPSVFPVNTNSAGQHGGHSRDRHARTGMEAPSSLRKQRAAMGRYRPPLRRRSTALWFSRTLHQLRVRAIRVRRRRSLLATLTVYNEGLNTTDWLVTAPSATGTPNVLHCGPGATAAGSVCVATYP